MKVKIFSSYNINDLEKAINVWLENDEDISVCNILQSESDTGYDFSTTISIFYHNLEG